MRRTLSLAVFRRVLAKPEVSLLALGYVHLFSPSAQPFDFFNECRTYIAVLKNDVGVTPQNRGHIKVERPPAEPTAHHSGERMFTRLITCLIIFLGFNFAAMAAEIKVLAPNAAKESVTEAISVFENTTGHKVSISWSGTEAITKRVVDGEAVDVVVNAVQNIDRQSKEGKLVAATRTDFAKSGIGVAVPSSAARIDVATQDALRSALLSAKSVVVSSGTSGRHMVEVFAKLGIGEQVKAKTKQPPSGAQIADFLAVGDADIGFQQISELLHAKGINYLGPVPADFQNYTTYSAAISAGSANADIAKALLEALRAPSTQAIIRTSGMEPI